MKSFRIFFVIFHFSIGVVLAQTPNNSYTIRGQISTITHPVKMVIFSIDQSVLKVDSCASNASGEFEFAGSVNIPVKATITYVEPNINAIDVVGRETQDHLVLFLEPGQVSIQGSRLDSAQISGGQEQSYFEKLLKRQLNSQSDSVNFNFIQSYPSSYVSLWLLKSYTRRADPEKLDKLFKGLDKAVRESEAGLMVEGFVKTAISTSIGKPAIEFTLPDLYGETINLAKFKGKVILIDFWASWCGPCRLENKDVLKVYKAYASKGFEIIGVSIDSQIDKWKKAIADDKLTWHHVCDVKQEIAKVYGIRSLPQNLLIDARGIIVGKNLRSKQLESKLKEFLAKKK